MRGLKVSRLFNDSNRPLIIILLIVFSGIWIILATAGPKAIDCTYEGIKYQAGNEAVAQSTHIEVKGTYWKGGFGEMGSFKGKIIIDDMLFDYTEAALWIYKDNSASLSQDAITHRNPYGNIFFYGLFEYFTIEIFESDSHGGGIWSSGDGWLISTPCSTRSEAVILTNKLLPELFQPIK